MLELYKLREQVLASQHLPNDGEEREQVPLRLGDPAVGNAAKLQRLPARSLKREGRYLRPELRRPGGIGDQCGPPVPWALGNTVHLSHPGQSM